jgi:nucleotide-binding universal stress UspA family protein
MKTIVVGYDGSEAATRALDRTGDLAAAFASTVVVTSISPVMTGAAHGGGSTDPTHPPEEQRALLDKAQATLAARGVTADAQLGMGDPADAIVQLADERDADLIVVGTREPGFFERLLGHSVSESVQRHAHCDVMIVH